MIDFLASKEDTLAFRISGKLLLSEMEQVMDLLEARLGNEGPINLYAEIESLTGIDDFRPILSRSRIFFSNLFRFSRVAVVTDIDWIAWASRLESVLLPMISYRVFGLKDAEEARRWVDGEIPDPAT